MNVNMLNLLLFGFVTLAAAGPATENYKDQFCTDPRTMQKHQAYTEWADAYSCTRHRCQPGGRNLAIYTVGCKRVEAPESAIECEEVVEDTNMQFPYCCTRLRCLVVVRGEVWTRVLGQPWETLPAAPWSHMYKMKKPPPGDSSFLPKVPNEGPVYELTSDVEDGQKVLRTNKKMATDSPDCNEIAPRAVPAPDIVIALSTNADQKDHKKREPLTEPLRSFAKRHRKPQNPYYEEEMPDHRIDDEEQTEKAIDAASDEKSYLNAYVPTPKPYKHHQVSWTEVPQTPWHEDITDMHQENDVPRDGSHQPEFPPIEEKTPAPFKDEKPANLQALVDAIGTRMRDIENVVQRMSEKVHQSKPVAPEPYNSAEKRAVSDTEVQPAAAHKRRKDKERSKDRTKRPNTDDHYKSSRDMRTGDQWRRLPGQADGSSDSLTFLLVESPLDKKFSVRNRGSKYLHAADSTTEQPLFVEDNNMNGYFSDASNNLLRRVNPPKLRRDNYYSKSNERVVPEVLEEHERTQNPHEHASEATHEHARETTPEHAHVKCNHSVHAQSHAHNTVEPAATYMAPVENRRKSTRILTSDMSEEGEKKRKKHGHKRKKSKGSKGKKSRKHNKEKKKHVAKVSSAELDRNQDRNVDRNVERNVVSLEDSSALAS